MSASVLERQQQQRRTDFEETIGDDLFEVLLDQSVFDISIRPNGKLIVVGTKGRFTHPTLRFGEVQSETLARAILQTLPRVPELNAETPSADCKVSLSDGKHFARVHIDSDELTHAGYNISIRKQHKVPKILSGWVADGQMTEECLEVFDWTVTARRNVIFCGKMMSGKTTLRNGHNIRVGELDPRRAQVEVMDVDETICNLDSYLPLFTSKTTSASDLCKSFVRTSSEVIGVNELRGSEAYDLVHDFWISGHNGGSSTMHVETPEEAGWRLKTLIAQSGNIPQVEVIAKAVHVLVFLRYAAEIGRRVTRIVQITGVGPNGDLTFEDLVEPTPFEFAGDSPVYVPRRRRPA